MDETEDPQPENEIWPPLILDSDEPIPEPDLSKEIIFGRLSLVSPLLFIVIQCVDSGIWTYLFDQNAMPALAQILNYWGGILDKHAQLILAIVELLGLFFGMLGRKSLGGKIGLILNLITLPFVMLFEL